MHAFYSKVHPYTIVSWFKRQKTAHKVLIIVSVLVLLAIPFMARERELSLSQASSTDAISFETEAGTLAGNSIAKDDATASAGKKIAFTQGNSFSSIKTVFVIAMENKNWSSLKGNSSVPYLNSLLTRPDASYANQYFNPPGLHPSEPNYIWMEAGTNALPDHTFTTDSGASASNSTNATAHLATLLQNKGLGWKSYQEDISGTTCPLSSSGLYAAKHNPFVFFQDLTDNNSPTSVTCIAHNRPYTELAVDLANNAVAAYNFITPNLCNDMHDCPAATGDAWLSREIPKILNSSAYQNNGALFITWDEGSGTSDGPIGMILLSPLAKGNGYANAIYYDHSSYVKTIQEIFGLSPFLTNVASSTDLSDLFALSSNPIAQATSMRAVAAATTGPIAFRSSSTAQNGTGATTVSLPTPVTAQPSDVMLAHIVVNQTATTITPPTGWTLVLNNQSSSSVKQATYYKVASSTEPSAYTFTLSQSQPATGGISAYSGVDTTNPIDTKSAKYNASTATTTFTQVTTTVPNDMLVTLVGVSGNTTVNPPSGIIEHYDMNNPAAANGKTVQTADIVQTTTGLTTIGTGKETSGSASNLTQVIALRPATIIIPATPTEIPTATSAPSATPSPTTPPTATFAPTTSCSSLPSPAAGTDTTTITVPLDGTYSVWSRIMGYGDTNNSFYLQIDSDCPILVGDMNSMPTTQWDWVNYHNGDIANRISISLSHGTHTMRLIGAEPLTEVDRIILTPDSACIPTDTGDNCSLQSSPTPTQQVPTASPNGTITFRSATTGNNAAGATSLTITKPATVQTGDVMLAQVVVNKTATTITPPTGWTTVLSTQSSSSIKQVTYYKVATATEPTVYIFTLNSSQAATGGINDFAGVSTLNPINASSGKYNATTNVVSFTQVTTTVPNTLLVTLVGVSGNTTVVQPTGFTPIYSVNTTTNGKTAAAGFTTKATVGLTTVGNASYLTTGISNLAQLIVLRPQ